MFTAVMMAAGLAAGYTVAVGISMVLTFAVTMAFPKFVVAEHLVRNNYKLVHEAFWFICASVGGLVTALIARDAHPLVTVSILAATLLWVLWDNNWEARQRGTAHQILITALTVIGVAGGYVLQRQML